MKKIALAAIALFLSAGCATTSGGEKWNDATVEQLSEGMTIEQVEGLFGTPTRTQTLSGGRKAYVYIRSSDEAKGKNKYLKIASLGMVKTVVADALSVMFQDGRVVEYKYEENADNNMVDAGGF